MDLPKDPVMAISLINTYLRDSGETLGDLCENYGWSETEINKLAEGLGLTYDDKNRRFL